MYMYVQCCMIIKKLKARMGVNQTLKVSFTLNVGLIKLKVIPQYCIAHPYCA